MTTDLDARIAAIEQRLSHLFDTGLATTASSTLYTPQEVAAILRCGKSNVYELIASNELAVIRIGAGKHGMRIKASDLDAFLESRRTGGPTGTGGFKHLKRFL
jgi:excisionase family DNA binding protein